MDLYQYSPLLSSIREIRLLILIPGVASDSIHLELRHVALPDLEPPVFEALSYVWGSREKQVQIYVNSPKGNSLLITENLAAGLKYLRYEDQQRVLWIDAICIDQNNVQERSQQVAIMGSIYSLATRVVVWLGLEADNSALALDLLDNLGSKIAIESSFVDIRGLDWTNQIQPLPYNRGELNAIFYLISRPWFERLWIRQEIHLANSEAVIMCGTKIISWQAFRNAILYIRLKPKNREVLASNAELFYERIELTTQICDNTILLPLEYLLGQARISKCSDPRDRVYAMLNMLHPSDKCLGIIPDYSLKTATVYQNLVLKYIDRHNSLRILSSCEIKESPMVMPSWVPDWSAKNPHEPLWICGQAGLLLAHTHTDVSYLGAGTLRVAGIFCATITEVYDITFANSSIRAIIEQIRKIASTNIINRLKSSGSRSLLEAYCRTLCCDEFGDKWWPPKPHFPRIQKSVEDIASFLNMEWDQTACQKDVNISGIYLSSVWKFCRGRSFFSTREGYIGLGPKSTKAGDEVCSLFGRDTPLILRPITQGGEEKHQVVGECYAHGLMAGEAVLGSMPQHVEQIFQNDGVFYLDKNSQVLQREDPRLRSLLADMVNRGYIGEASVKALREKDMLELLRKLGIAVESIDLI